MKLLTDKDLQAQIQKHDPIIKDLAAPLDWYGKDSPVQPSSVDLHIGNIFLPGTKEDEPGGEKKPKREHVLKTGETSVVVTKETLQFPDNIAGIGFPPARVSSQGLLMTNPGHVDPGYAGPMRFTVINMGSEVYVLREGDPIVTLLVFELSSSSHCDWLKRRKGPGTMPTQQQINKLSKDFVDVERRAIDLAKKEVENAELAVKQLEARWIRWGALLAAVVTLLSGLISGFFLYRSNLEEIRKKTDLLQHDFDAHVKVEQRLDNVEHRLKTLEDARNTKSSTSKSSPPQSGQQP